LFPKRGIFIFPAQIVTVAALFPPTLAYSITLMEDEEVLFLILDSNILEFLEENSQNDD
jgi:hypothetical protein